VIVEVKAMIAQKNGFAGHTMMDMIGADVYGNFTHVLHPAAA